MVPLETHDAGSIQISAHDGPAFEVEYHPDGARIATSGRDGKAVISHAVTLVSMQRLQPHQSVIVWDVPWNPTRHRVATVDHAGFLHLWDPETDQSLRREQIATLQHPSAINMRQEIGKLGD